MSIQLRRSERLKTKQNSAPAKTNNEEKQVSMRVDSHAESSHLRSKKSEERSVRQKQLEIGIEKKKQELEQLRQEYQMKQELLDMELQLQAISIEKAKDSDKTYLSDIDIDQEVESEVCNGPSISKWIRGENPYQLKMNTFNENDDMKGENASNLETRIEKENCQCQITTQLTRFLTRQSVPKDLPYFDGDPTEWPTFINQYLSSTRICDFSDEENLCRLQKALKGNARRIVQSLLILPRNVKKILEILENRYGRPELIISMTLEKVRNLSNVKSDKLEAIVEFADTVKNLVGTIESLDQQDHLRNPLLLQELLNKLPISYQLNWIEHFSTKSESRESQHRLLEFASWLESKAYAANQLCTRQVVNRESENKKCQIRKNETTLTTNNIPGSFKKKCICCEQEIHHLSSCPSFKTLTNEQRWKFVTTKKICFSCLLPNHTVKTCKKRKSCNTAGCKKPHHELLHGSTETNCHIASCRQVLLKILPVTICYNSEKIQTYALLDDASTVSLIDEELANKLKLEGPSGNLSLKWTNNQTYEDEASKIVTFSVVGNGRTFQLRHVRTMRGLSLPQQTIDMDKIRQQYPYLNMKLPSMREATPLLLIGQDNWPLIINRRTIRGPWNGPVLSKTLLGWTLHGNINKDTRNVKTDSRQNTVCHIRHEVKDELDIVHDLVKEQWKIDSIGIKQIPGNHVMSRQDIRAQEILNAIMRRVGQRIETGLLWSRDDFTFPESKSAAMNRLRYTERKMDRDETYSTSYCEKMKHLEDSGYIRKLTRKECLLKDKKIWYLPHFGVINPNKPNKLRIVFDASGKSNGVSLNDFLLTGPDLYNSLYTILLNFRIKKHAFTADIKEMFLQVQVRQEDRLAQRFLWRGTERDREPDIYEICVVFFGSKSGPCLAQEAKNRNASEFAQDYPEAVDAIIKSHYMDDYLGGADTIEEAKKLIQEVIYVHQQASFVICNWITNSPEVLEEIDPTLMAKDEKNLDKTNSQTSFERILGVWWDSKKDVFSFRTKFHKIDKDILENRRKPTKRDILKIVMSIFDPLGFIAHLLVQGKIILQHIWRALLNWDEEITDNILDKWLLWVNDLKNIEKLEIPRQYSSLDRKRSIIQLHIFCDACEDAYATVAYLRFQDEDNVEVSFVMAKARVSPLKPTSIPRLELQAALIAARLGSYLQENLELNITSRFFWTDSKTVLHWVRSEAKRFKVFVAQRVGEIQEITNIEEWKYVPSCENMADEATKRYKIIDMSHNCRWLNDPEFLRKQPNDWPEENVNQVFEEKKEEFSEIKVEHVMVNRERTTIVTPIPQRFSKWMRLLRTMGWIIRFVNNCKNKDRIINELTLEEIHRAEMLLYIKAQEDSFPSEVSILKQGKYVPKSSRLFTLCCFVDEFGLIRLGGRIDNASRATMACKQPIVLDSSHRITQLIIQFYHENAHHLGKETVLSNLRQKFWIIRARQAIRKIFYNCQVCRNKRASPEIPIMGQLPDCRLEPTIRAFIKTGVDYFGPLEVSVKRSREKRYGVIFTCMVTRAVHLEIAYDLSTNSFIHVLRQFISRRGTPDVLFSDNGKNFKGAESELSKSLQELNQDEIMQFCTTRNIEWNFNPPAASHMGGCWERLIQTIKKNLKEVLKSRCPPEYTLRTLFAECENMINSRPLTHVSVDPADPEPLTPNHFLIGVKAVAFPFVKTEDKNLQLLNKWKAAQRLADMFWSRWTTEYLLTLVKRTKWYEDKRKIQVDDIVVMVNPNGPRNTWQKGRNVKTFPGKDGKVRVVEVLMLTQDGNKENQE